MYGVWRFSAWTTEYGELIADPGAGPDEIVIAELERQAAHDIWHYVDQLAPRHRLVLIDRYRAGRHQADTAADLGVTPSRVSQLQTLAFAELRELMEHGPPACRGCRGELPAQGSGRPRKWCTTCKPARIEREPSR